MLPEDNTSVGSGSTAVPAVGGCGPGEEARRREMTPVSPPVRTRSRGQPPPRELLPELLPRSQTNPANVSAESPLHCGFKQFPGVQRTRDGKLLVQGSTWVHERGAGLGISQIGKGGKRQKKLKSESTLVTEYTQELLRGVIRLVGQTMVVCSLP
jgi:hypothetical protein